MISRTELKSYKSLAIKKFRAEHQLFLIEGARAVREAASSSYRLVTVAFTRDYASSREGADLLQRLQGKAERIEEVKEHELATIADTVHAQGIVAVTAQQRTGVETVLKAASPGDVIVALDGVADPGNLGSIIRTSDWFGVRGIVLGKGCVDLYNPKVVRTTMGSLFHIAIAENVDLPATLGSARTSGFHVAVTDAAGETSLAQLNEGRSVIVVFGNEAWGVSEPVSRAADIRVAIPRFGSAESLNVGVACGVVLAAMRGIMRER